MQTRSPRQIAVEFLQMIVAGDIREAYRRHVAPGFRHHNPWFPGDADALMRGMEENHGTHPHKQFTVRHALEDGDFVAVHSELHFVAGDRGMGVVHLFRFEGQGIVEFWDLGQEVPADSPNQYGMF
ncbi:MAG TPA: nuclear transport factor 2 family protein [Solimonas sp.]|nr:nuclear transport factor 2 family protein [Solimonas sp.]